MLIWSPSVLAIDQGTIYTGSTSAMAAREPILQPYQPITGGYTFDSDDVGYMDVTLSVKIRLLPKFDAIPRSRFFLAMTTRFGFYWNTRPHSPAIGKDYNPKAFWRFLPNLNTAGTTRNLDYVDVGYAHESNGQIVHTQAQYQTQLSTAPQPEYANQFIHRGWDYPEIAWKTTWSHDVASFLDGKYFLPHGFLQGAPDEYHSWEMNPQGKPRRTVDGLTAAVEYPSSKIDVPSFSLPQFDWPNLIVKYQTGYDTPLKYSTARVEIGMPIFWLPVTFWYQHGYMSDLAMYYLKVNSYGIELRFVSF